MKNIRIGFVPVHRDPFNEDWAVRMRKRCLQALSRVPRLDIIAPDSKLTNKGLVRDDADAEKTIRLFREKSIDGLLIGTMTFGDEISALAVASAFKGLPILLFGTKEGPFTKDGARRSDSFCGTLAVSSGLHRRKLPFLFAGVLFPEEDVFLKNLLNFVQVCSITSGFTGARIGLVGPRPERFETCICNEDAMIRSFNQRVVPASILDIMQRLKPLKGNAPELQKIINGMKKETDLSSLKPQVIRNIAGLQYALRQFADEKGLSAMAVQCWSALQEVYGISACYAFGRLNDMGFITACEVDVYGAMTMLIQHLASLKAIPPHFIDWTIQHQKKDDLFLAWHCGNAPPSLACPGCKISLRTHSILSLQLGEGRTAGTAEFPVKPGIVTLCRLTEDDGEFKMLITKGEAQVSNDKLRGSWSWVKVQDLHRLYNTLVNEGFTHHASMIHGDYERPIEDACCFLHIETIIV
ncbi:MAG: L-fucose/L-arabinose isomerase family protein [Dehalococcoidia bacterium]|nr:L-fucose/L-arabinose isomerase family protein [Dehalococcoidia bacterium]